MNSPSAIPYVGNANSPGQGHGVMPADGSWEWLLNDTSDAGSPAALARQQGGMWIHNPFGRMNPMGLEQFLVAQGHAICDPGNARLQNTADADQFIAAASQFKSDGLWLCCYFGGGELSLPVRLNESSEEWAERAMACLDPVLQVEPRIDAIGFDATLGKTPDRFIVPPDLGLPENHYDVVCGLTGGQAILVRKLQDLGITVYCEPAIIAEASWLRSCSVVCLDSFKELKEERGWWIKDSSWQNVTIVDPTTLAGKPALILKKSQNKPNDEKLADIAAANADGYDAVFSWWHFPSGVG